MKHENGATLREEVWLCLSGGNALGAYHAGVYIALHEAGIRPTRIAGASIGGLIGAIIAGNRVEDRLARLKRFWELSTDTGLLPTWFSSSHPKTGSAFGTFLRGRPALFYPSSRLWWKKMIGMSSPALFDRSPLRRVLPELINFELLNNSDVRLIVNAVDVESGDDVTFDTADATITADHLLATTAFPVLYPPEVIAGRTLVDGGVSANLPLTALFTTRAEVNVVCLAFDLLSPRGFAPQSLDHAINRAQDLILSKQSQKIITLVQQEFDNRQNQLTTEEPRAGVALYYTAYDGAGEIGAKTLEYSKESMLSRTEAGKRDGALAAKWQCNRHVQAGSFTVEMAVG